MQLAYQFKLILQTQFFSHTRLFVIIFLFFSAFAIRLDRINEPPMNFHAVRQYHSLLIARGYYFETLETIPAWKKQVARISMERQGTWEPHTIEFLASVSYRIVGDEHIWIPRLLSSVYWLIGGGFLCLIARKIASAEAAIFSTAFYLFIPFGVLASRSFQPDPLMIMGSLMSVYAIILYYDQPSVSRLFGAGMVSALAILVKFVGLFWIFGVFISIGICGQGLRRFVTSARTLVFIGVSLFPAALFYSYQIFSSKSLLGVAQGDILPQLLLQPFFWKGWLYQIGVVAGYTAFILALLGTFLFEEGLPRGLIMGLWIGYFVFGLVFTYTVHTHDYWNLAVIPITALSLGPIATLILHRLELVSRQWYRRAAVRGILLLALLISIGVVRPRLINPNYESKVKTAEEIGKLVDHSTNIVYLASDYGLSLEYHGELSGVPWPLVSDLDWERLAGVPTLAAEERFGARFSEYSPEYFIVEDLCEFDRQPDLKRFLSNFPIVFESNDYLIFDLTEKQTSRR